MEKQEEEEPIFLSKKQDIPPFDIPVSKNQAEEASSTSSNGKRNLMFAKRRRERTRSSSQLKQKADKKKNITKEREEVSLLHLVQKSRRPTAPVEKREQKKEAKQAEPSEVKAKTSESLSIADFFSRKQEEEHVRVKVCIVQKGETLDDLAERYSISVQSLLQSNELQPNQDIYEGQVLYIRQSHTFKN